MSSPRRASASRSAAAQEARIRAAHAVSLQRANPTWCALPGAVEQDPRGRWRATGSDRELFAMRVVTVERDVTAVTIAGSRKRSLVGVHHAAIHAYLLRGDRKALDALAGKTVAGLTLQTDPAVIRELYRRGELSFLEIYTLTR